MGYMKDRDAFSRAADFPGEGATRKRSGFW
jgi:hypothetical protein